MKIIKLILCVILLGVLGLGAVYVAENRGMVQAGTFANLTSKLSFVTQRMPKQLNVASVGDSVKTMSSQAGGAKIASGAAVLGNSIEVEAQEPPMAQKAFEFARYNYCQAVVKDYEARQK